MTEKNKQGWIEHHSSTASISINILNWRCTQPKAVEQWRLVSHCLVCLPVGFEECSAKGAPGGKARICFTLFSLSKIIRAELLVFWLRYPSINEYLTITSTKQTDLNQTGLRGCCSWDLEWKDPLMCNYYWY